MVTYWLEGKQSAKVSKENKGNKENKENKEKKVDDGDREEFNLLPGVCNNNYDNNTSNDLLFDHN